jgi:hypothetical protein
MPRSTTSRARSSSSSARRRNVRRGGRYRRHPRRPLADHADRQGRCRSRPDHRASPQGALPAAARPEGRRWPIGTLPAIAARRCAGDIVSEYLAAAILMLKGYRIVALRYRTRLGEIDIIARKGDLAVFVEVKARREARQRPSMPFPPRRSCASATPAISGWRASATTRVSRNATTSSPSCQAAGRCICAMPSKAYP